MKKLFFIAILASLTFCFSCNKVQKEELQPATTTTNQEVNTTGNGGNGELTFRSCGSVTDCECTVTTDINVTLIACGDLPTGTSGGCGYTSCNQINDASFTAAWTANSPKTFCVSGSGTVCLLNTSTTNSVGVRVQFSGGTVINDTIPANDYRCFHTNSNCETFSGC